MDLSVTVPEEPADRVAVLDADLVVWQRRDDLAPPDLGERRWMRIGATHGFFGWSGLKTWAHLVVDSRALTLLVPEDMVDGWQRAGYLDPLAERLPDAAGGPGAPTPDQAPTRAEPDPEPDGPSAAEQAYTRTTTTDELGGPLGGGMPPVDPLPAHLRRPIRDSPQA